MSLASTGRLVSESIRAAERSKRKVSGRVVVDFTRFNLWIVTHVGPALRTRRHRSRSRHALTLDAEAWGSYCASGGRNHRADGGLLRGSATNTRNAPRRYPQETIASISCGTRAGVAADGPRVVSRTKTLILFYGHAPRRLCRRTTKKMRRRRKPRRAMLEQMLVLYIQVEQLWPKAGRAPHDQRIGSPLTATCLASRKKFRRWQPQDAGVCIRSSWWVSRPSFVGLAAGSVCGFVCSCAVLFLFVCCCLCVV